MDKNYNFRKIIIDGSYYLYRAFHSEANLHSSSGIPTGAIHVMLRMISALMNQYNNACIAVVFDAPGKNFRHEIYQEYKANRSSMPDDLKQQVPYIKEIITAIGIPVLAIENLEADDVIGVFAKQANAMNENLLICTGDKDLAQLVTNNVFLLDTKSDTFLDREGVLKKFGVAPELIVDYLALMGDKSDNIPGLEGVGPKTAVALLQNLGNIENILQNISKIESLSIRGAKKLSDKIKQNIATIKLSKKLATIKTDDDIGYHLSDIKIKDKNQSSLKKLYKKLELNWLLDFIEDKTINDTKKKQATKYYYINTKEDFLSYLEKLKAAKVFAIDTETTSLDINQAELVGISLCYLEFEAVYIPLQHIDTSIEQLDYNWVISQLKPILENKKYIKVMQNAKYDINILYKYDIPSVNNIYDTMLESYVLNSTYTRHNMDAMALKYLDYKTTTYEEVAGKGKNQISFDQVAINDATDYAAEDADVTLRLHNKLWKTLGQNSKLKAVFTDIEMPLVPILAEMERNGLLIDSNALNSQSKNLEQSLKEIENSIYEEVNDKFNILSTKQLQNVLFDKLKLPVIKKTATGKPSTSEDVLQELAFEYSIPEKIISYRSLYKLKTAYTDKLPAMVNTTTNRLHTTYHQAVTSTGRLSSSEPNIQNIPIKTKQGRIIREAFIASQGSKILAADYSQVELRIMAHLSGDDGLIQAFKDNLDIHRITAAEIFSITTDEVTDEQRRKAKAINFGLIYGMSAFGLSKQIDVSLYAAKDYINTYFSKYPKVKEYMEKSKDFARENGYVETIYSRRLYLPQINSSNSIMRNASERLAINAPMQGSASDIIKKAMCRVNAKIRQEKYDAKMIMQVHDELVFEVKQEYIEKMKVEISKQMSADEKLSVPLVVDIGCGNNWGDAH